MSHRLERNIETVEHAQKQERMAYKAKTEAMQQASKELNRLYGDQIMDLDEVFVMGFEVRHHYESTSIDFELYIEPTINSSEEVEDFSQWRQNLKDKINEIIEYDIDFYISFDWGERE